MELGTIFSAMVSLQFLKLWNLWPTSVDDSDELCLVRRKKLRLKFTHSKRYNGIK